MMFITAKGAEYAFLICDRLRWAISDLGVSLMPGEMALVFFCHPRPRRVDTLLADGDDLDREDAEAICGAWQSETKSARGVRVPVPDEYSHDDLMEAKAHAEELAVDAGAIHAHGEGDERSFMPGASHVSLVAHLRQEGLIDAEGDPVDDAEANDADARGRAEYDVGDTTPLGEVREPDADK